MKINDMGRMNFSLTDEVVAAIKLEVISAVRRGADDCRVNLPYTISECTLKRVEEYLGKGFITAMRTGYNTMVLKVKFK